ncbi:uncharacterized protein (DUF924 family) [Gemmobacter caeni]|uniref:Uncharacterized protein (DUF924 family) n=1 Tax=Gemmobacter caeni TaxID=589035 RepID=A0A2T6BBB9_9RHOB|nr:DUF924 family protein [Gemmobacter caeni]PTX53347.1 uncharacterized protein (DUF924 family) [Gemmobacter caeni]TWJ05458.1 uncharacterized protein (DUF924 family) [Gemmobacter caeni]
MSDPVQVLDYWLGEVGPEGWYAGGEALDADIRDRWLDLWQAAHDGGLDHWAEGPAGALALLVLTDQFSRNMFRGEGKAFSTDPLARAVARKAVAAGWDLEVPAPERQFFYLPFEHSEDPADQAMAVELIADRLPEADETLLHARAHQAIIARFGRFPFRNAALGRESSPEETAFMEGGGYASMVNDLRSQAMR